MNQSERSSYAGRAKTVSAEKVIDAARKTIIRSIIFLYSIYSFVYAANNAFLDYKILLVFSILASLVLLPSKQTVFSRKVRFIYLYFLGLSTLSVFFRSSYTSIDSLVRIFAVFLLSGTIVACFVNCDESENAVFKWGLLGFFLTLVSMAVLEQSGIPVKKAFPEFAGFKPFSHNWNQKYYAAWLVFLMWGTISFHWGKNIFSALLATGIITLTGIAIFTGYSESTKTSLILSIIVFILMHVRYSRWLILWQTLTCFYILGLPFLWGLLPSSWLLFLKVQFINRGYLRINFYSYTVNAILKNWFWGYGFDSVPVVLKELAGGHPHNIVLFSWLELGILGALLLAMAVSALLSFIDRATRGRQNAPAVWALFSSGLIIFSFSFSAWIPGFVLLYIMWLAMIMLSCQDTTKNQLAKPQDGRLKTEGEG